MPEVFLTLCDWEELIRATDWKLSQCPLPEGRTLNSLCAGCEGSTEVFPARFLTMDGNWCWMESRSSPMILSADQLVRFLGQSNPDRDLGVGEMVLQVSLNRVRVVG